MIPKPIGAAVERKPQQIIGYGKSAVVPGDKIETEYDKLYEEAREGYLQIRDNLMQYANGYWVAVSSHGDALFFGTDQCELTQSVDDFIKSSGLKRVFYVNCVGREILAEIEVGESMDNNDATTKEFW